MVAADNYKTEVVVELVKAEANVNSQNNVRHCIYVGYWPSITKCSSKCDIFALVLKHAGMNLLTLVQY